MRTETRSLGGAARKALLQWVVARAESVPSLGLACFAALLYRHTQQSAFSILVWQDDSPGPGAEAVRPTARASQARQREPSGLWALHCEVSDDTSFTALLARVEEQSAAAEILRPRDIAGMGGANALFATPVARAGQTVLELERWPGIDVALTIEDDVGGLLLQLSYDSRAFTAERMRELLAQYEVLVERACQSPEKPLLEHSLVTALGRKLLPDPREPLDQPRHAPLSETILSCATAAPSQVAIRHDGRCFTYGELAQSSASLARCLLQKGIAPGEVVAVTGPRSFAVVSAMLGVFRSGGVLLTLDPKLPLERRKIMLEQSGAKVLVYARRAPEAPGPVLDVQQLELPGLELVEIDAVSGLAAGAVATDPPPLPTVEPEWPAYVFFTSGSTGMPKAVKGRHQGLAHFLAWQRATFGIESGDRSSQLTALSFDVVLRDTFLALSAGATLCIPAETDVLDPPALLTWLEQEGVTVVHVVPSLARVWLNHVPPGICLPRLRRVFFAGEPLTDVLVDRFREAFGRGPTLVNLYGPTETTLAKCFHIVAPAPDRGIQPIGRTLPETQVLILNRRRQVCGVAEVGEIAIRTPFRTLGYLNAAEANARAFIPNPFRDDPDDLIYLTGDSGRYRADGLLEILGRIDNQVKIRGVRVEPGEVEATLARHPDVREAAVVAREDASGNKILAAYAVPRASEALSDDLIADMREFLSSRLPEPMVPSAFVLLDALPLNANGKVDKKALPPPPQARPPQRDDTAPRTTLEADLVAIWSELLGVQAIGIHHSFAELGGDSLTAIAALIRMRRLGLSDELARGVFQGKTIAELARRKETGPSDAALAPKRDSATTSLVVNVLRAILVVIVIVDHWAEGTLKRFTDQFLAIERTLVPLFNAATPGFAFVFGLGLGYVHYTNYKASPQRANKPLRFGAELLASAIAIDSAFVLVSDAMRGHPVTRDHVFMSLFGPLLYYLLAVCTAPLWFRFIARFRRELFGCACLAASFYLAYRASFWLLVDREQTGFVQLCRLMLMAKFSYFNMSTVVLGGVAAGIYLRRHDGAPSLSRHLLIGGAGTAFVGLGLLYGTTGGFSGLNDADGVALWRWAFYAGLILVLAGGLQALLRRRDQLPAPLRRALYWAGALGQCTFPVYVLHGLLLSCTKLLRAFGVPERLVLAIPLTLFFVVVGWMTSRLYRLYYGAPAGEAKRPAHEAALAD
jgi:amino acid adenylation domain-containing protein